MNKTNFVLTGGWPLNAERLEELETAYSIFNAFGALAGNFTIISGCVTTGSNVSDGRVYINGELFDFKGGAVTPTSSVIIIETPVNRAFENTDYKTVHTLRYATFGTAETSWLWSDFKRLDPIVLMMEKIALLEKKTAIFQAGGAAFPWFKPAVDIPEGFQEVEDIRGKTIIGYDPTQTEFNEIGKIGGAKSVTLTKNNIPPLDITLPVSASENSGGDSRYVNATDLEDAGFKTYSSVVNKGVTLTKVNTLNPYRIAMYIEFIG